MLKTTRDNYVSTWFSARNFTEADSVSYLRSFCFSRGATLSRNFVAFPQKQHRLSKSWSLNNGYALIRWDEDW